MPDNAACVPGPDKAACRVGICAAGKLAMYCEVTFHPSIIKFITLVEKGQFEPRAYDDILLFVFAELVAKKKYEISEGINQQFWAMFRLCLDSFWNIHHAEKIPNWEDRSALMQELNRRHKAETLGPIIQG